MQCLCLSGEDHQRARAQRRQQQRRESEKKYARGRAENSMVLKFLWRKSATIFGEREENSGGRLSLHKRRFKTFWMYKPLGQSIGPLHNSGLLAQHIVFVFPLLIPTAASFLRDLFFLFFLNSIFFFTCCSNIISCSSSRLNSSPGGRNSIKWMRLN